jgi:hypothetical protein
MARNKFDVDETLEKDSEFSFARLARLGKYVAPYKTYGLLLRGMMMNWNFSTESHHFRWEYGNISE